MIGRAHRFHGRNGLRRVYTHGKTVRGQQLSLKVTAGRPDKGYRLAVVVSKKVSKSAVVRNRIRRRLYEAFRLSALANESYDVVATVFSEHVGDMPADELKQVLESQLSQAGIGQSKAAKHQ